MSNWLSFSNFVQMSMKCWKLIYCSSYTYFLVPEFKAMFVKCLKHTVKVQETSTLAILIFQYLDLRLCPQSAANLPLYIYSQVPNRRIYSFRYHHPFPNIFVVFPPYSFDILPKYASYPFIRSYSFMDIIGKVKYVTMKCRYIKSRLQFRLNLLLKN